MISRKLFAIALAIAVVLTAAVTFLLVKGDAVSGTGKKVVARKAVEKTTCAPDFLRLNVKGQYRYISPLLLTELSCSSPEMDNLKSQIAGFIDKKKREGVLTQASVYLKTLKDGRWFEINGNMLYNPGSLMKLAIMLTYLREEEQTPGILNKRLKLTNKITDSAGIDQIRTSAPLKLNEMYTVKDLIYEMIVNSDNDATHLLNLNISSEAFTQVMYDLGSRATDISDPFFEVTVMEYNRYFRVLFNASYVSREHSDWALGLLTNAKYRNAFMKYLPEGLTVAHKFGERPYDEGFNFHEAGLVYLNNNPYLLVVMTKGKDKEKLPEIVAEISKISYDHFTK